MESGFGLPGEVDRDPAPAAFPGLQLSAQEAPTLPAPLPPFPIPFPSCLPPPLSSSPHLTFFSSLESLLSQACKGLPSCCGVTCGRGLRPRCRGRRVGEERRAEYLPLAGACCTLVTPGRPLPPEPRAHMAPPILLLCAVPQRTSPTGPKNMQTSGRPSNVAPPCILRKNPPSARNGGHETDAQILELNQQVSGVGGELPQQPGPRVSG